MADDHCSRGRCCRSAAGVICLVLLLCLFSMGMAVSDSSSPSSDAVRDDLPIQCFICRTPIDRFGRQQKVLEMVRKGVLERTTLSSDADRRVMDACDGQGNMSLIPVETCPTRACVKLAITDEKGASLMVMRGCIVSILPDDETLVANRPAEYACRRMNQGWHYDFCFCGTPLCNRVQEELKEEKILQASHLEVKLLVLLAAFLALLNRRRT